MTKSTRIGRHVVTAPRLALTSFRDAIVVLTVCYTAGLLQQTTYVTGSWTCLRVCTCTNTNGSDAITQVTCVNTNITAVPRGLPPSVILLDLSNTRLTSLALGGFGQLPQLLYLRLRNSAIETIADGAFRNLDPLQTLDLAGNRLQTLGEKSLQSLPSLQVLDLSDNDLAYVDGAFAGMRQLSRLDLHDNNLTALTRFTFRDLVNLQHLLLGGNAISSIERETFQNLEKLMYLVLRGNPIGGIPRLDFSAPALNFVDLSECGLHRLPRGLPSSIRYLQLRRNNLTVLRKSAFIECPYVGILILDDNGLTEVENKTFIHMTYLQQLWLNNNRLSAIPPLLPSSLQRIYLDFNKISGVVDVFPANSQIETLSLMGNNISAVSSEALRRLPKLRFLDLSSNRLSELRGHTFSKSTQLRKLVLSKNPLQYFHHHSLRGLRALRQLYLAYVDGDPTLPRELFDDLRQLRTLDLTNSPGLIQAFVQSLTSSSPSVKLQLSLLEELSLLGSQLTTLSADAVASLPGLKSFQLTSTRWHCDVTLTWLRDWLRTTRVHVEDRISIVCFTPRHLYLKPVVSLADDEFAPATSSPLSTTNAPPAAATPSEDMSPEDMPGSGQDPGDNRLPITDEETDDGEIDDIEDDDLLDIEDDKRPLPPLMDILTHPVTIPTTTGSIPDIDWNKGGDYDDELDDIENDEYVPTTTAKELSTNANSTFDQVVAKSDSSHATSAVIVAVTAVATLGTAALLILLIVHLAKKQSKAGHSSTNGKSASLMFDNKKTNGVAMGTLGRSGSNIYSPRPNGTLLRHKENEESVLGESMTLIPGRDINHEGPLRVYKWEEF